MKVNTISLSEKQAGRESQEKIGALYGVHQTVVSHIKTGRKWANVTGAA